MIIVVTHIDNITSIPVTQAPARNGPKLPELLGLKVLWAKTSKYPTEIPEFVCKVPDGQYINIPGVLGMLTSEEEQAAYVEELAAREVQSFDQRANPIRNRRNELLAASDIYVIVDYPISENKRNEWKAYRQELRDVTLQSTFPDEVIWPTEPIKE